MSYRGVRRRGPAYTCGRSILLAACPWPRRAALFTCLPACQCLLRDSAFLCQPPAYMNPPLSRNAHRATNHPILSMGASPSTQGPPRATLPDLCACRGGWSAAVDNSSPRARARPHARHCFPPPRPLRTTMFATNRRKTARTPAGRESNVSPLDSLASFCPVPARADSPQCGHRSGRPLGHYLHRGLAQALPASPPGLLSGVPCRRHQSCHQAISPPPFPCPCTYLPYLGIQSPSALFPSFPSLTSHCT
jgi:hypothetical protein